MSNDHVPARQQMSRRLSRRALFQGTLAGVAASVLKACGWGGNEPAPGQQTFDDLSTQVARGAAAATQIAGVSVSQTVAAIPAAPSTATTAPTITPTPAVDPTATPPRPTPSATAIAPTPATGPAATATATATVAAATATVVATRPPLPVTPSPSPADLGALEALVGGKVSFYPRSDVQRVPELAHIPKGEALAGLAVGKASKLTKFFQLQTPLFSALDGDPEVYVNFVVVKGVQPKEVHLPVFDGGDTATMKLGLTTPAHTINPEGIPRFLIPGHTFYVQQPVETGGAVPENGDPRSFKMAAAMGGRGVEALEKQVGAAVPVGSGLTMGVQRGKNSVIAYTPSVRRAIDDFVAAALVGPGAGGGLA